MTCLPSQFSRPCQCPPILQVVPAIDDAKHFSFTTKNQNRCQQQSPERWLREIAAPSVSESQPSGSHASNASLSCKANKRKNKYRIPVSVYAHLMNRKAATSSAARRIVKVRKFSLKDGLYWFIVAAAPGSVRFESAGSPNADGRARSLSIKGNLCFCHPGNDCQSDLLFHSSPS